MEKHMDVITLEDDASVGDEEIFETCEEEDNGSDVIVLSDVSDCEEDCSELLCDNLLKEDFDNFISDEVISDVYLMKENERGNSTLTNNYNRNNSTSDTLLERTSYSNASINDQYERQLHNSNSELNPNEENSRKEEVEIIDTDFNCILKPSSQKGERIVNKLQSKTGVVYLPSESKLLTQEAAYNNNNNNNSSIESSSCSNGKKKSIEDENSIKINAADASVNKTRIPDVPVDVTLTKISSPDILLNNRTSEIKRLSFESSSLEDSVSQDSSRRDLSLTVNPQSSENVAKNNTSCLSSVFKNSSVDSSIVLENNTAGSKIVKSSHEDSEFIMKNNVGPETELVRSKLYAELMMERNAVCPDHILENKTVDSEPVLAESTTVSATVMERSTIGSEVDSESSAESATVLKNDTERPNETVVKKNAVLFETLVESNTVDSKSELESHSINSETVLERSNSVDSETVRESNTGVSFKSNIESVCKSRTADVESTHAASLADPETRLQKDMMNSETLFDKGTEGRKLILEQDIANHKTVLEKCTTGSVTILERGVAGPVSALENSSLLNFNTKVSSLEGTRKLVELSDTSAVKSNLLKQNEARKDIEIKPLKSRLNPKKLKRTRKKNDKSEIIKPHTRNKVNNVRNKYKITVIFVDKARDVIERIKEPFRTLIDEPSIHDTCSNTIVKVNESDRRVDSNLINSQVKTDKSSKEILNLYDQSSRVLHEGKVTIQNGLSNGEKVAIKNGLSKGTVISCSNGISNPTKDSFNIAKGAQRKLKEIQLKVKKMKGIDKSTLNIKKKKAVNIQKQRRIMLRNRGMVVDKDISDHTLTSVSVSSKFEVPVDKNINLAISQSVSQVKQTISNTEGVNLPEEKKVKFHKEYKNCAILLTNQTSNLTKQCTSNLLSTGKVHEESSIHRASINNLIPKNKNLQKHKSIKIELKKIDLDAVDNAILPVEDGMVLPAEGSIIPLLGDTTLPSAEERTVLSGEENIISPPNESKIPSAEESTIPSAEERTLPSAEERTIPSAEESMIPSAEESAIPPAVESTIPPAVESTIPPAVESTIPPAVGSTIPPAEESIIPPAEESIIPPAEESTISPAEESTIPPAEESTIPSADESTIPPAEESTIPPAEESTIPSAEESTIPPADESIILPEEESTIPPAKVSVNLVKSSYPNSSVVEKSYEPVINTIQTHEEQENILSTLMSRNKDGESINNEKEAVVVSLNEGNQRVKRRPVKLDVRLKQEVQEKCCGHWFPNKKRFIRHLIESSKNEVDSLHTAKLIDLDMHMCSICSIWLNNINMKKHVKVHDSGTDAIANSDTPKSVSDDKSLENKSRTIENKSSTVENKSKILESKSKYLENNSEIIENKSKFIKNKSIEVASTLPKVSELDGIEQEGLQARVQKPCPKSKKINFNSNGFIEHIKCDLNAKESDALGSIVFMSSLNDLPDYLKPSLILQKCKIKVKKKVGRKRKKITPRYIDLLNEGTEDVCKLVKKKNISSKCVDKAEAFPSVEIEGSIRTDTVTSGTPDLMEKIDKKNDRDLSDDLSSKEKNLSELKQDNSKKTDAITTNKVPKKFVKKKLVSKKKNFKATVTVSKPSGVPEVKTINDKSPSITLEIPAAKCKQPIKVHKLDSNVKRKSEKFKNLKKKLQDSPKNRTKNTTVDPNKNIRKSIEDSIENVMKGTEGSQKSPRKNVMDSNKNVRNSIEDSIENVIRSIVESQKIPRKNVVDSSKNVRNGMEDSIESGTKRIEDSYVKKIVMGKIRKRRRGRDVKRRRCGFHSDSSDESSDCSESSSSSEFGNEIHSNEEFQEIEEVIPTVELDLFTLSSLNEDVSVLLVDPKNPNFKVLASMDAIFVGDSALGDVTNQMGYVSDDNVVYISPNHFLFPEISDSEDVPLLKRKNNIKSRRKLKNRSILMRSIKIKARKKNIAGGSSLVNNWNDKENSCSNAGKKKNVNKGPKIDPALLSKPKLKVRKKIVLPINATVDSLQNIDEETHENDSVTDEKKTLEVKETEVDPVTQMNTVETASESNSEAQLVNSATVAKDREEVTEPESKEENNENEKECSSKLNFIGKVIVIKTSTRKDLKKPVVLDNSQSKNNMATVTISTNRKRSLVNGLSLDTVRLNNAISLKDQNFVPEVALDSLITNKQAENIPYEILADSKNSVIPKSYPFSSLDPVNIEEDTSQNSHTVNSKDKEGSSEDRCHAMNSPSPVSKDNHLDSSVSPCKDAVIVPKQCLTPVKISTDTQVVVATAKIVPFEEEIEDGFCLEEIINNDSNGLLVPNIDNHQTSGSSEKISNDSQSCPVSSDVNKCELSSLMDSNLDIPDILEDALLSSAIISEKSKDSVFSELQSEQVDDVEMNRKISQDIIVNQEPEIVNLEETSAESDKVSPENWNIHANFSISQSIQKISVKIPEILEIKSDTDVTSDSSENEIDICGDTYPVSPLKSPFDFKAVVHGQNLWNTPLICLSDSPPQSPARHHNITPKLGRKSQDVRNESVNNKIYNLLSPKREDQSPPSASKEYPEIDISKSSRNSPLPLSSKTQLKTSLESPKSVMKISAKSQKSITTTLTKLSKSVPKISSNSPKSMTKTSSKSIMITPSPSKSPQAVMKTHSKSSQAVLKASSKSLKAVMKTPLKSPKAVMKTPSKSPQVIMKIPLKSPKAVMKTPSKSPQAIMKTSSKSSKSMKMLSKSKSVKKTSFKSKPITTHKKFNKTNKVIEVLGPSLNIDNKKLITPEKHLTQNKSNTQDESPKATINPMSVVENSLYGEAVESVISKNITSHSKRKRRSKTTSLSFKQTTVKTHSQKSVEHKEKLISPTVVSQLSSESLKMRIYVKDFSKDLLLPKEHTHKHKKKKKHSKRKREKERRLEEVKKLSSENLPLEDFKIKTEHVLEDTSNHIANNFEDSEASLVKLEAHNDEIASVECKKENEEVADADFDTSNMESEKDSVTAIPQPLVVKHFHSPVIPIPSNELKVSSEISESTDILNHHEKVINSIKVENEESVEFGPRHESGGATNFTSNESPVNNWPKSNFLDDRSWHSRGSKLKAQVMITDQQKGITNSFVAEHLKLPVSSTSKPSKRKSEPIKTKDIRNYFTPNETSRETPKPSPNAPVNEIPSPSPSFSSVPYRSPPFVSPDRLQGDYSQSDSNHGLITTDRMSKKGKRKHSQNMDIRRFFAESKATSEADADSLSQPKKTRLDIKTEVDEVEDFNFEGFERDSNNCSEIRSKLLQEYVDVLHTNTWFDCDRFAIPIDQLCDWNDDQLNVALFEKG